MKDCLGVSLGSHDGVCTVRVPLEDTVQFFKLFLQSDADGLTINMNGIIPNKIIGYYDNFDEVYIVHENIEKKFSIDEEKNQNYSLIKGASFNLSPSVALGTLLRVYIKVHGNKELLGDCSVGLRDANLNETDYIMTQSSIPLHEETQIDRSIKFEVGHAFIILLIMMVVSGIWLLVRRKAQQSFEDERGVGKPKDVIANGESGKDVEIATDVKHGDYVVFPEEVENDGVL